MGEEGFTMLEMLVASSILALVIAIAMPLMLTAFRDRKRLQTATDRIQSLRQVASLTTQDARFATGCEAFGRWVQDSTGSSIWVQYLRLTSATDAQGVHVIDYIFANKLDVVDYSNLHRLQGTIPPGKKLEPTWERDDIAGRHLVWSEAPNGSWFGCQNGKTDKHIWGTLVTYMDDKAVPTEISLDVFAYFRPH